MLTSLWKAYISKDFCVPVPMNHNKGVCMLYPDSYRRLILILIAFSYTASALVNCEECVFIVGTYLNLATFSKHLLCDPKL